MGPIRRLPKFIRIGARCVVMLAHHKHRGTHSVVLGSRPAGPISYGYHMLDSVH